MSASDEPRRGWRRARALLPSLGYAVAVAVPVTALALLVRERFDAILAFDEAAVRAATDVTRAHPGLYTALAIWQEAFQPRWLYLVGTGLCVWLWVRHRLKTRAIWAFVTMMAAWNLGFDLKYIVQRVRPVLADPVSHAPGYSFPSGHATNAAAAATVLTLLVWPVLRRPATRYAVCAVAVVVVVLTALDRVFLGVHYPSDVVAGVLVGAGLAWASYVGYRGWNPARPPERPEA